MPVTVCRVLMRNQTAVRVPVVAPCCWSEPLNLYTLVAMPPANRKSAVFASLVRPVEAYEAEQLARVAPERSSLLSDLAVLEARLKDAQKDAGGRKKSSADIASQAIAQQDARDIAAEIAMFRVPALPRYIVGDVTPEKLATMLCEQDGRMAVLDDEGGFFDILAGRYSNGSPNIDVVLKGHSGATPLRVDRGSRTPEFIAAPALTLGLAVQPAVLDGLADSPSFRGRGLLGRLLYCLPASPVGGRAFDAPTIPSRVSADYDRHITALMARSVRSVNGVAADMLTLTAAAVAELRSLHNWLEPQQIAQAQKVWRAIEQRGVDTVTKRDIWRYSLGGIQTADDLDAPLGLLVRHGYLRLALIPPTTGRGRKPSPVYEVNPLQPARNARNAKNTTGATFTPVEYPESHHSGISGISGSPPAAPISARYSVINRAINGPPHWCVIAPDGSVGKRSYATESEAQAEAKVCNAHADRIAHS